MPQNKHCNIRLRAANNNSPSEPVDVIIPFDVVAEINGIGSVVTVIEWLLDVVIIAEPHAAPAAADVNDFVIDDCNDGGNDDVDNDDDDDNEHDDVGNADDCCCADIAAEKTLLWCLVARLFARAEIRRFKSSRNNDFNGDTYFKNL